MRNKNLDGARGLAALSVALAHCATATGGIAVYAATVHDFGAMSGDAIALRIWHSIFNGDAAVILFFALSGFVLGRSLERGNQSPVLALAPYLVKRAFRLLPATIIAGVVAFALESITIKQMVGAMFIYDSSANGVLWSLQVEVIGSIMIFVLWATQSRLPALLLIAFYAYAYRDIPNFMTIVRSEFTMLPAAFVLGYVVPLIPKSVWRSKSLGAAGLAVLLLSDLFLGRTWDARIGQVIGAFLIVGALQANPIRLLNSRAAQFLGSASYSFYLIHPLLIERGIEFLHWLPVAGSLPLQAMALGTLTIPVSLATAHFVSVFIEAPGIRLGGMLVGKIRSAATPTAIS